ncbi:MAG TPA: cytochrome P450 [Acidimicrobiales bacterium]|nr:cytochrome P450 [Acidimicrobiales bacterium]
MSATDDVVDLREVELFDPEHWADPHPLYHHLRAAAPIWRNERYGEWVLTRFSDCEAVLRDPRFSTNPAHLDPSLLPVEVNDMRTDLLGLDANVLLFMDPPDHTRLRRLVNPAFSPRAVEALRARIRELVAQLLDEAAEKARDAGEFDVLADLGYPLPVIVICELLGVPADDRHLFGPWSSAATRLLDGDLPADEANRGVIAAMNVLNYLNGLIEDHRAHPRDDLLSKMIAAEDDGESLTEAELRLMAMLLFLAGHETTMNLIGNGAKALLQHRREWERLCADPSLVPSAVEELLRYDGPVHMTARIPTADIEVGGHVFRKGEQLVALLAAANRDPARFADPDRLDVTRPDNRHLAFSHGIHICLGAALARIEAQEAFAALARRFPDIDFADGVPEYRDHRVLRGLRDLRVTA